MTSQVTHVRKAKELGGRGSPRSFWRCELYQKPYVVAFLEDQEALVI
jgi:hypothetical protein